MTRDKLFVAIKTKSLGPSFLDLGLRYFFYGKSLGGLGVGAVCEEGTTIFGLAATEPCALE